MAMGFFQDVCDRPPGLQPATATVKPLENGRNRILGVGSIEEEQQSLIRNMFSRRPNNVDARHVRTCQ